MEENAIYLFPGIRYGTDCPLLYYAALEYGRRGYKVIPVDYGNVKSDNLADFALSAVKTVKKIIFPQKYNDVIFASKSVGTVIALAVEDGLKLNNVRHILLTPIDETLPLMQKRRKYICAASSDTDTYINAEKLKAVCNEYGVPLTELSGLGHRLESKGGAEENVKILESIVKLYK